MLKTLAKSIRQYKLVSILTPIFIAIEAVMEAFMVYYVAELINILDPEVGSFTSDQINEVWKIVGMIAIMATISLAMGVANGLTGARASAGFAANLRKDIFHKIQDFSFENVDQFQTSSLITRLTTDISNLQMSYQLA